MRINSGALVVATLLGSGFLGGFCVSKGSGDYLGMKPVHSAKAQGGGRNLGEEAAAGIMAAGGGGSSEHVQMAGGAGGGEEGGGSEGAGGAEGSGGQGADGGGAEAAGSTRTFNADGGGAGGGAATAAAAKALATTPGSQSLTGAEAVNLLSGNSLKRQGQNGALRYTYFAPRGWQADGDEHSVIVRSWDRNSGQFCELDASGGARAAPTCIALEIRTLPGQDPAKSATIGAMRIGRDDWAFLVTGNRVKLPDHIPSLDSLVDAHAPAGPDTRLTASGKAAWTAMLGKTFGLGAAPANRRIVTYDREGRLIDVDAHDAAAAAGAGIKITMRHWTFEKGLLCQDGLNAGAPRSCYRPEAYGPNTFRLVAKAAAAGEPLAPAQRLQVLSEQKSASAATQD